MASCESLPEPHRLQLLELARNLDDCGRRTERFLTQQLQQLQQAIDEFEAEQSAWRRQQAREAEVLKALWDELSGVSGQTPAALRRLSENRTEIRRQPVHVPDEVVAAGGSPLSLLLIPAKCSSLQIGLLLFEVSKYNRELGGAGLRFEVTDCREPRQHLIGRRQPSNETAIIALDVFSRQPLYVADDRGCMNAIGDDSLDRWFVFKAQLLQSAIMSPDLPLVFKRSRSAGRDHTAREMVLDATRRADMAESDDSNRTPRGACRSTGTSEAARQQLSRLEQCVATLANGRGMKLHISLT
ncbi:MAG: hypothetical protein R3C19_08575 [Planctomycetaceae bacterium]